MAPFCDLPAIGDLLAISTVTPGELGCLLCSLTGLETLSSKGKLGKLQEYMNREECRKIWLALASYFGCFGFALCLYG